MINLKWVKEQVITEILQLAPLIATPEVERMVSWETTDKIIHITTFTDMLEAPFPNTKLTIWRKEI